MQWGQFVDHDITHTPLFRLSGQAAGIQCCEADGSGPYNKLYLHPECFPIEIPENDPFFMQHGQRCMHFVRSMPGPQLGCSFGYGEQMNQITALHDGSNVYGSDSEDEEGLRAYKGGLLTIYTPEGETRTLLPQEEEEGAKDECEINETLQELENQKCFKAGDKLLVGKIGLKTPFVLDPFSFGVTHLSWCLVMDNGGTPSRGLCRITGAAQSSELVAHSKAFVNLFLRDGTVCKTILH